MYRLSDENVSGELGISHKQKLNITTAYPIKHCDYTNGGVI